MKLPLKHTLFVLGLFAFEGACGYGLRLVSTDKSPAYVNETEDFAPAEIFVDDVEVLTDAGPDPEVVDAGSDGGDGGHGCFTPPSGPQKNPSWVDGGC